MPEMRFRIRWADEHVAEYYSPSRAIADFLAVGANYPLDEFVRRSRAGLSAASERVRAVNGFPCSRAAAQLAAIETEAARHGADQFVVVEAINPI